MYQYYYVAWHARSAKDAAHCYRCPTYRGLSVCVSVTRMSPAKRLKRLKCQGRGLTRNHILDRVKVPHKKGQFLRLSVPSKALESLLRCTQQKGSFNPFLNNGSTCDAAFRQNFLTTCSSHYSTLTKLLASASTIGAIRRI